ncbi:hypothetical protein C8R43DRAFT_1151718 [Mycena crocata]|nr:hypothetical protein C8R43DRAFT_1151718 [Mycena crocata]
MSVQQIIQRSIQRLRESPQQVLDNARRGSITDLKDLANFWQEVPELLSLGVLQSFFHHLDADKAFVVPSPANERSNIAECAFYSLLGLCKSGDYLVPGTPYHRDPAVLKAWPGRRAAMDIIATSWYCLVRADGMREVIAATQGSVEIATKLWLLEETVPSPGHQFMNIPCLAAALDAIIVDTPAADRALVASGGKAETIASIALSRARGALSSSPLDPVQIVIYLDLLSHLSRGVEHPIRHALLQAGVIPMCTRAAGTLGRALNAGGHPDLIDGVSTEGFTWVTQSLTADLLVAFADCCPHFSRLDAEDYGMVCSLLKKTLPQYLVYRSVLHAIDEGMQRLKDPQKKRIESSIVKQVWLDFQHLAEERCMVVLQAAAVKGKSATCDNVQCHRIDAKNTFRKCGACSTTLYCSKECQIIAWKEGGHKEMCKMKQRERLEGKSQAISKSDVAFFHHLATRDARHHLPELRRLARAQYPTLRPGELLIRIDYLAVPPKYSVVPIDQADQDLITAGSANAEARNDALFERARENPDRFGLIQSRIANGRALQAVLSVVTGNFWEGGDAEARLGLAVAEADGQDTDMDGVDLVMARTALNRFLIHAGEEPAF